MMSNRKHLFESIRAKRSFLCVGLDPDPSKIPTVCGTGVEGMEVFCKSIIDVTSSLVVAYKPNLAFFEQYGAAGWSALTRIIAHVPKGILTIADAKRGDIGNTASRYADAIFRGLGADAITVAPYMGADSVKPFTAFGEGKWTVLLALTSNPGASDFEFHGQPPLFERIIQVSQQWGTPDNLMYVIGATRTEQMKRARELAPDSFFLVPGIGAQGGSLEAVIEAGWSAECGLLVNASRSILYAGDGADYAAKAYESALALQAEMADCLNARGC